MFVPQRQGLLAQPVEQGGAVIGLQDGLQRVAARRLAHAVGRGQKVQVVVAQQAADSALCGLAAAQHRQGFGAPVDQIAQQINGVAAGGITDFIQKACQSAVAALHVAYTVKRHGWVKDVLHNHCRELCRTSSRVESVDSLRFCRRRRGGRLIGSAQTIQKWRICAKNLEELEKSRVIIFIMPKSLTPNPLPSHHDQLQRPPEAA